MNKTFFLNSANARYGETELNFFPKYFLEQGVLNTVSGAWATFSDLKVTENSPQAMSVLVAVGIAVVEITKNGSTFKIFAENLASQSVAIGANSSGSTRIDAIILRVSVSETPNILGNNIATMEAVAGTPGSGALSDNDIQTAIGDDGFIRLANVEVINGAVSIANAKITDTRTRGKTSDKFTLNPTVLRFNVLASDPSGALLQEGDFWYNSTEHRLKGYNGSTVFTIEGITYTAGSGISIGSGVIAVDSTVVRTSGAQTIADLITFGTIPELPASNPTTANQAVRKAYLDSLVAVEELTFNCPSASEQVHCYRTGKMYFSFAYKGTGTTNRPIADYISSATVIATALGITVSAKYLAGQIDSYTIPYYHNGTSWNSVANQPVLGGILAV